MLDCSSDQGEIIWHAKVRQFDCSLVQQAISQTVGQDVNECSSTILISAQDATPRELSNDVADHLPCRPNAVRAEIERNEMGGGWVGDSVEREWGNAMAWILDKKLGVTSKEGFGHFPENWLVLYDNWSLPKANFNLEKAVAHLATQIDLAGVFAKFSRILIVSDSKVIELESSGQWSLVGRGDPS